MTGTTRRLPAWEPEPLPIQIPAPPDSHRIRRTPSTDGGDDEREAEREVPGSHVIVIDID
jgi:hypothetical protein